MPSFVLEHGLAESDCVRGLHDQSDGVAVQGVHKDLHAANEHLHAGRGTLGIVQVHCRDAVCTCSPQAGRIWNPNGNGVKIVLVVVVIVVAAQVEVSAAVGDSNRW